MVEEIGCELVWERWGLQMGKRRAKNMKKGIGVEILVPAYDTYTNRLGQKNRNGGKIMEVWNISPGMGVCLCSFCKQRLEG